MSVNNQNQLSGETFDIECIKDKKSAANHWRCCDLKQFCAKVQELNEMHSEGQLRNARSDPDAAARRQAGDAAAADYRAAWNGTVGPMAASGRLPPSAVRDQFYHACAEERARQNGYQIGTDMQADHVHEIQLGGHPTDFTNLRWLSSSVNGSIGSTLSNFDPDASPGGIKADCCPAEARATCSSPASNEQPAF